MTDPTPTLKYADPMMMPGGYVDFDPTVLRQINDLQNVYYEIDFGDSLQTKVYVAYLLGSVDGFAKNDSVVAAELTSVILRYNERQAAITALQAQFADQGQ